MTTRKNSRLSGHELIGEGAPHDANGYRSRSWTNGRAKCSCGALSSPLPSGYKRKAWHRDEHKPEVRRLLGLPA